MNQPSSGGAAKFDAVRAADYDRQSRIALAGYAAMHELTACCLSAALGAGTEQRLLVVGAGTGQDVVVLATLEPRWRFTAVDPSPAMIGLAETRLAALGLLDRTTLHGGTVDTLSATRYDGATMIGVLHHVHGDVAKFQLLKAIAARLKPGAPLVLGGNVGVYGDDPLFRNAWQSRWRQHGAADEGEARFRRITGDVDPPRSEEAQAELLATAGFAAPKRFFGSLFWGGWLVTKA
jgi:tRNA (cmo5U34)-methyltransferase